MFNKVLIANRGEIAVRVARAVKEMGMCSVAVYSDADRDALHVRVCDEAYRVGPAPSSESYLRAEVILAVAKRCGAEAIHPGYGFMSENATFAQAVIDAGLIWIGPPPAAITAMGSKTVARETMIAAGVPVVPGSPPISDVDEALAFAQKIRFPVLVKASAGGGGKGMRLVEDAASFPAAFAAARREAAAAFGDDTVYVEKYVVRPKHVEFQLLSDAHGNHLHLFERDCSVQRRHQKVVEESPCPVLRPEVRREMGRVATAAAAAVDYVGAGTVEFLLDVDQSFYFLEMNTRLQVEHPITEMITGVDLVHWQLRIAAGEEIAFSQGDLEITGHAIECRVYAEDPANNYLPSPGTITALSVPGGPGVRDDSGVCAGAVVSTHYDPMISKLVTWGKNRVEAIARMQRALAEYKVRGITTNLAFHEAILAHERFSEGDYDTQFLSRETDALLEKADRRAPARDLFDALSAVAMLETSTTQAAPVGSASDDGNNWKRFGRYHQLKRLR